MNFDFSSEQKEAADQVGRLLANSGSLSECRRALDGEIVMSALAWRGLAEVGFQALLIDEAFGGFGMAPVDICLISREIGYSLAPVPSLSSVYIASAAIQRHGDQELQEAWLPKLAAGEVVGTFALPVVGPVDGSSKGDCNWVLNASELAIPDARAADLMLLADRSGADFSCYLIKLKQDAVTVKDGRSCDPSRPLDLVDLAGAQAVKLDAVSAADWQTIVDRAAIFLAFEQVGAATRALEMARDYALQRYSFGRPIGSYQAIKHKLADVYALIEIAVSHAYYGAWALTSEPDAVPLAAAGARVAASRALRLAAQENIQVHGGIGYTWESDCQLFYRRARYWNIVLGSDAEWRCKILDQLRAGAGTRYAP